MPVVDWTGGENLNKACVLFNNLAAAATITPDGELADHPAINTVDPATYSYWQAPGAPTSRVRYTFASPQSINAIGLAAHTIASSGASFHLEVSVDGTSWTTLNTHVPTTDADLMFIIPQQNYRGVGINFSFGAPAVGIVFIGQRLDFPCTPIDNYRPIHHARQYDKVFTKSLKGHFLGNRVMGAGGSTEVSFPMVQRNFVDFALSGFEDHYNRGGYFFYAGYPGGKPRDMGYCRAPNQDSTVDVTYVEGDKLATLGFGIEFYVGV